MQQASPRHATHSCPLSQLSHESSRSSRLVFIRFKFFTQSLRVKKQLNSSLFSASRGLFNCSFSQHACASRENVATHDRAKERFFCKRRVGKLRQNTMFCIQVCGRLRSS